MPLYEYRCSKCEKVHELIQKFSDAPLEVCPDCGGSVSKLIGLCSFSLKGTGWYTTDYKKAPSSQAASKSGGAKGSSESVAGASSSGSETASSSSESASGSSSNSSGSESKAASASPAPAAS